MIKYVRHRGGPVVPHRRWTEEELQKLAELADTGMMIRDIAAELGRSSTSSVTFAMRRYGIGRTNPVFGWDEQSVAQLTQLSRQGLSARQIAELMPGRSRSAVQKKRMRLGLDGMYQQQPRQVTFDLDDTDEL